MSYGLSLTTVPKDLYYVERKLVADQAAEITRLRSVMRQTEDAMNSACLRDGGSYWLPAPGHHVETWSGNLNTALELSLTPVE